MIKEYNGNKETWNKSQDYKQLFNSQYHAGFVHRRVRVLKSRSSKNVRNNRKAQYIWFPLEGQWTSKKRSGRLEVAVEQQ